VRRGKVLPWGSPRGSLSVCAVCVQVKGAIASAVLYTNRKDHPVYHKHVYAHIRFDRAPASASKSHRWYMRPVCLVCIYVLQDKPEAAEGSPRL